jgi:serine phosphatase RsbU (regulator of sigma subunit)/ligand-binding sensor domain-containing protein
MKLKQFLKLTGGTILCLFLFSGIARSQNYSFRNYGSEFNIADGFINTISQADNGYLWVGTGSGISLFDGFNYYAVKFPDSTKIGKPKISFKSKNGTIWFGCNAGEVYYSKGNGLVSVNLKNSRSISQILETGDGRILIIPQGRLIFSIDPNNPDDIKQFPVPDDPLMLTADFTDSGDLLIGSQGNILVCSITNDTVRVKETIEGFDYSNIRSICRTGDKTRFVIGTEDNGIFQLRIAGRIHEVSRFAGHPEWTSIEVNSIMKDREDNIWVSTNENGVIQFSFTGNFDGISTVRNYNKNTGLSLNDVKVVFQDSEGNFWFGLYSDKSGLSMLSSYSFAFFTLGEINAKKDIIYINKFNDKYLLGTPSGFHLFDPQEGKSVSFVNLSALLGKAQVTCYYLDKENNLWIGTDGKGLYVRNNSGNVSLFYRLGDSGSDPINDIVIDGTHILLATTNGFIVIDRKTRQVLKKTDMKSSIGILPSNFITKILINKNGKPLIGANSSMLYIVEQDTVLSGSGKINGTIGSFTETASGEIWVASSGNGIFKCRTDSVINLNRSNSGLYSNYCYSILADSEGSIWVGHTSAFSRYNSKTRIMETYGSDFANIGTCNPNAIFESADNKIFIGTTEGLIIYDRKKDNKHIIPPYNNINSITINDKPYDFKPLISLPYNKYRITVNFTGINFSSPEKVWYSTYLDGFDVTSSRMSTNREATYTLSDGKYKFVLVSVNEMGLSQEPAVSFDIVISKPWWRTWWSMVTGFSILVAIVVLIIRERDKSQKKIQLYLETELDARTSIVIKQKGEIELQNIEITDSINYAKRIQTSILPDINKLKDSFKDAFILFHPRDIVSGDFYWFDKLSDEKFILVCADSTGHGVPGAFMSMIGSTLLQDIVTRKGISKPSEILTLLDKQIFSTLNQNVELGVSNDGMDVVVCEFNIKTRHLRFASAMRPVILVMDGEPFYIKGNRSSVGGETVMEKFFDDQEYYLNEGDTLYLFSDGLPDQFGGTDGKKMKIARLKRIIEQVSHLPMEEQKEAMSKFYFEWKGSYDQVDDVLLMAVKV